jgi:Contractile injection system tube protein
MERVAFLIEETNQRIGCLLNPETVLVRRVAGVRPRRSTGGQLTGTGLTDDPLIYTGGGRTELDLDLLFDVALAGSTITTDDVRDLTGPLWNLAENAASADGYWRPPVVRFVWGKAWNMPGVVGSVSERFEQFSIAGTPQRSWLRIRLLRVAEPLSQRSESRQIEQAAFQSPPEIPEASAIPAEEVRIHEFMAGERLDEIAYRYYQNGSLWKLIAAFNGITDPTRIPAGRLLQIPPLPAVGRTA